MTVAANSQSKIILTTLYLCDRNKTQFLPVPNSLTIPHAAILRLRLRV